MEQTVKKPRIALIAFLILAVTLLHYSTGRMQSYHHLLFREFYFLPIILSAFWFGLKGGFAASLSVSCLYIPHIVMNWQNFSPDDLDKVLELLFFNVVAVVLGAMKDMERKRQREKEEAISAMAGTIAHELNTPVQIILGSAQLLQEEFQEDSEQYKELEIIIENTQAIVKVIRKISLLDRFVFKKYAGKDEIFDLGQGRTMRNDEIHR